MNEFFKLTPYVLLPSICGVVLLILSGVKFWRLCTVFRPETVGISNIWKVGIIGMLLGILGQVLGVFEAFDVPAIEGTIHVSDVVSGVKESMNLTLVGLGVLIVSWIFWLILGVVKREKTKGRQGGVMI